MVKEIRIYIEGGGDYKETKRTLRQGFSECFKDLVNLAREHKVKWNIIACGSRNSAFDDFKTALRLHTAAFNVLLVDSEAPVAITTSPSQHLKNRDDWDFPPIEEKQIHFMVQMMEAWIVADVETLQKFYGQRFHANSIPKNKNVEQIAKTEIEAGLKTATQKTQKGEYHKTRHAPDILKLLDMGKVRGAAPYCERLFETLKEKITS